MRQFDLRIDHRCDENDCDNILIDVSHSEVSNSRFIFYYTLISESYQVSASILLISINLQLVVLMVY